ncbi:hypothetical protein QE152_g37666 [Popillia japonica]|uniref:Uncharacterized protein n=1 Tax=Popillia japonica TaxID=7064 RepID=A0AAW1I9A1_POPJA
MNAAWTKIWPQCVGEYFSNIALPKVNTSQLINIGRQIRGKDFEDLDDSDILEVLQADDTELAIEDLVELHPKDNQGNQADSGIVVSKDLLSINC